MEDGGDGGSVEQPIASEPSNDRSFQLLGNPGGYTIFIYFIGFMLNAFVAFNHVSLPQLYAVPIAYRFNALLAWDLICDRRYILNLAQSLYMVGVMVGSPLSGMASDYFGRRPLMLICLLMSSILSIALPFIPNLRAAIIVRFFTGFFISGVHCVLYILPTEITSKVYMPLLSVAMMNSFIIGVLLGCVIAFVTQNWQITQLALCAPSMILLLIAYIWLPESPRWSLARRKKDRHKDFFERAIQFNKLKKETRNEIFLLLDQIYSDKIFITESSVKFNSFDLFKSPRIRQRSLIGIYLWFTCAVSYYTLSYNMPNLHENPLLAILLGSATDLPSFVLAFWYIPRYGKRRSLIVLLFIGGTFCLMFLLYRHLAILLIGKAFLAVTFGIVFIYLPEIYPTVIRNIGIGTLSFFSRLGSVLAPQIILIGECTDIDVPMIVVGCLSIVGGFLTFAAPETKGRDLPVAMEDVELIEKGSYTSCKKGNRPSRQKGNQTVSQVSSDHVDMTLPLK